MKKEITLRDALFLTHPKPQNDEQKELFKKIAENTLEVPYTWEVELSKLGQDNYETEEAKTQAFTKKWEELIDSKKIGYMALLRNLRNILEAHVSREHVTKVTDYLSNPVAVKKSKQLPFRFFSAYLSLESVASTRKNQVLKALEDAVKISIDNVVGMDCDVLIASDVSASMESTISGKSQVQFYDIGLLLGQLLALKAPNNILGFFGDTWKTVNIAPNNPLHNTLQLHEREGEVGYSTNGYKVIEWLIENNVKMDKVFIFTDCQMWDSEYGYGGNTQDFSKYWNNYKKIAPNAKLYLFDVSGYGNTPIDVRQGEVHLIAGWSDKVFDMLEAIEQGETAVKVINQIEI